MKRREFLLAVAVSPLAACLPSTAPSVSPQSRILFSPILEPNWIDFPEPITGLVPYRDDLLIFTDRAIYALRRTEGGPPLSGTLDSTHGGRVRYYPASANADAMRVRFFAGDDDARDAWERWNDPRAHELNLF